MREYGLFLYGRREVVSEQIHVYGCQNKQHTVDRQRDMERMRGAMDAETVQQVRRNDEQQYNKQFQHNENVQFFQKDYDDIN